MEVLRIFDLLDFIKEKYNKEICLAGKKSGRWVTYSIDQYREMTNNVSQGLMNLGVVKGDNIANFSNNRPEWNIVDLGIMQIGAVHIPIYPNISDDELLYILNETGAKIIFVANNFLYSKINSLLPSLKNLQKIFTFDNVADAVNWHELLTSVKPISDNNRLDVARNNIIPEDLATIIYTSGTTGTTKGVMLSHRNLVSNFIAASKTMNLDSSHTTLSYLPLCHVYERMLNYKYQYLGIPIYYAESLAGIISNFQEVKPTVLTSVPLLLEKIYGNIVEKGSALSGIKKLLFTWAMNLATKYDLTQKHSLSYKIQLKLADIVYKKWRNALGGKLGMIICGGAALQTRILKAFWAAGIPVYEGYGLTESSPLIANNNFGKYKLGTVGKILDGVEVKIAEDGEILCKGPNIMLGYFNKPELTAEVIDKGGWLHTGDIGVIEEGIFLRLTGRKKDIFKTSAGVYVVPEMIENMLRQSPLINMVLVAGANQSYLSVLIVPNFETIGNWCIMNRISYSSPSAIIQNQLVIERYKKILDEYNLNARETEQILKFKLLEKEWTIMNGELTPKMSIRRNVILQKNKNIIDEFYK
jgi:long-chain acyl-CoA synthetase